MFQVWVAMASIATPPLADFTPSPNTWASGFLRESEHKLRTKNRNGKSPPFCVSNVPVGNQTAVVGLPKKGVRKKGCTSLILRLFAFVWSKVVAPSGGAPWRTLSENRNKGTIARNENRNEGTPSKTTFYETAFCLLSTLQRKHVFLSHDEIFYASKQGSGALGKKWSKLGKPIYYHYWCWRVGGAVPVRTGTGNIIFLDNTRDFPEILNSTGARFLWNFGLQYCTGNFLDKWSKVVAPSGGVPPEELDLSTRRKRNSSGLADCGSSSVSFVAANGVPLPTAGARKPCSPGNNGKKVPDLAIDLARISDAFWMASIRESSLNEFSSLKQHSQNNILPGFLHRDYITEVSWNYFWAPYFL